MPAKNVATLDSYQQDLNSVQKYLKAWKVAIEKTDEKTGTLSNESDRNSNAQLLNASLQAL